MSRATEVDDIDDASSELIQESTSYPRGEVDGEGAPTLFLCPAIVAKIPIMRNPIPKKIPTWTQILLEGGRTAGFKTDGSGSSSGPMLPSVSSAESKLASGGTDIIVPVIDVEALLFDGMGVSVVVLVGDGDGVTMVDGGGGSDAGVGARTGVGVSKGADDVAGAGGSGGSGGIHREGQ